MLTTNVMVITNDKDYGRVLFTIDVFKNVHPNSVKISSIFLSDIYQGHVTYGDVLKDLGKCVFMQIIKSNIINAGRVRKPSKVVGKIA